MNIIYETTKERGATILMPSSMVDSMNPYGNTLALAIAGSEVPSSQMGHPRQQSRPCRQAAAAAPRSELSG